MAARRCKAASSVFIRMASSFGLKGKMSGMHFVDWRSDIGEKPQGAHLRRGWLCMHSLVDRSPSGMFKHGTSTQKCSPKTLENKYYETFCYNPNGWEPSQTECLLLKTTKLVVIMCSAYHNILPPDKFMFTSYFIYTDTVVYILFRF